MQEVQVLWDTLSSPSLPWYTRFYAVFLCVLLVTMAVRTAMIIWNLKRAGASASVPLADPTMAREPAAHFAEFLRLQQARVAGMRGWVHLVLIVSLSLLVWEIPEIFARILPRGTDVNGYLLTSIAEATARAALAVFVCVVIYAFTMYLSLLLRRRRFRWDRFLLQREPKVVKEGDRRG